MEGGEVGFSFEGIVAYVMAFGVITFNDKIHASFFTVSE